MKQAYWGFLAGVLFMAAVVLFQRWELSLTQPYRATQYRTGVAVDLRDC